MASGRIWLDVPYGEKDQAKAQGARWDAAARRWYAPRPDVAGLARWEALTDVPDLLPGEDRSFGGGLFVDLVPSSCWFTNARSCVSEHDWERLRRMIVTRADQRCEICGRPADRDAGRWLEVTPGPGASGAGTGNCARPAVAGYPWRAGRRRPRRQACR